MRRSCYSNGNLSATEPPELQLTHRASAPLSTERAKDEADERKKLEAQRAERHAREAALEAQRLKEARARPIRVPPLSPPSVAFSSLPVPDQRRVKEV